ncbi:MAG TPA: HIT domain-containing protein [archaeon]|nr:HIT domain-containing protein [archaeon]
MYNNYLWAANRSKYLKNHHSLQSYKGCLLCGVVHEKSGVIRKVLYKDKLAMVILNIFPYSVGHVQVVPIRHVETLEGLTKKEHDHLFDMVRRTVILLKKTFSPAGINIGMNIGGDVSGASIAHIHVQIVPRYKRDLGFMEVTASTKVMSMTLDQVLKKLKKNVKILKEK